MRLTALLAFVALGLPVFAQTEESSTSQQASTDTPAQSGDESVTMPTLVERLEGERKHKLVRDAQGPIGSRAQIQVRPGYVLTDAAGAGSVLELNGNLAGSGELAVLAPESFEWWALFAFDDQGYVSDEEKDELDADALLEQKRARAEQDNEARLAAGLTTLELEGWAVPPHYNETTNNLEWATRLRDASGHVTVNHHTNLLGRRGVMNVILVCAPDKLEAALVDYREQIAGFEFVSGERYSEYTSGDKVAALGLTALVAGGAGVIAAKTGLFAKFWKYIVIAIVAVGAFVKKLLGFGKKEESSSSSS